MVRGVCIIFVILIHSLFMADSMLINCGNIVIRKIINCAVATFIFMAGYFTNIKSGESFIKKKVFRLLPALIIWDLIYTFIVYVKNDFTPVLLLKTFALAGSASHLYYIYVLLQLFILAPLLVKFIKKFKNNKIVYLPFIITPIYNSLLLILNIKYNTTIPLYQYYIFGWFSYYYLGLFMRECKSFKKDKLKPLTIMSLVFLIFSILEGFFIYKYYNLYGLAVTQLGVINVFYSMTVCLILCLLSSFNIKINKFLKKMGDYSFGIYLSHMFVLINLNYISINFTFNYYLIVLFKFLGVIIICYVFNKIYYDYLKDKISFMK